MKLKIVKDFEDKYNGLIASFKQHVQDHGLDVIETLLRSVLFPGSNVEEVSWTTFSESYVSPPLFKTYDQPHPLHIDSESTMMIIDFWKNYSDVIVAFLGLGVHKVRLNAGELVFNSMFMKV